MRVISVIEDANTFFRIILFSPQYYYLARCLLISILSFLSYSTVAQQPASKSPPKPPTLTPMISGPALQFVSKARTACMLSATEGEWFDVKSVAPFSDMTYLETQPLAICSETITRAARRGRADIRLIITPKVDPATVSVSITPFTSSNGKKIAANIRYVQTWYQAFGSWHTIGRPLIKPERAMRIPELLVNDDELIRPDANLERNAIKLKGASKDRYVTLAEDGSDTKRRNATAEEFPIYDAASLSPMHIKGVEPRQLWISLDVPEDAVAGEYTATLELRLDASRVAYVPLAVTISTLSLNPTAKIYSIYYKGRLETPERSWVTSDHKSEEQMLAEFRDMRAHGITNPIIYQPTGDADLLNRYMSLRRTAGFTDRELFFIYLNTNIASLPRGAEPLLDSLARVRKNINVRSQDMYVYGQDEANSKEMQQQAPVWAAVKSQGYKVYATGSYFPESSSSEMPNVFTSARAPDVARAAELQRRGSKVLNYANPQGGAESPYIYRSNYGLGLWAADYDGAMIYAYQDSMGDGWNDFDHSYRDHNLTYPSASGPIPTIAWLGLATAIEDMRLLETVDLLSKSFSGTTPAVAQEAQAFLMKIKNQIKPLHKPGETTEVFYIDFEALRSKLISFGEQLAHCQSTDSCR